MSTGAIAKKSDAMCGGFSQALNQSAESGLLTEEQFLGMNRSFLQEKARLEARLGQIERELERHTSPREQETMTDRARELLRLDTLPRELATALIGRIEIGERDPSTGEQVVGIHWKF